MSEWSQIKSIEMLVSQAEQSLNINNNKNNLILSCDLLNIARGRCNIILNKKDNFQENINCISINSEKPIMKATKSLTKEQYENFLSSFYNYAQYKFKKIKIVLFIDKPIAIDNEGFLNIEENLSLKITDIELTVPIL